MESIPEGEIPRYFINHLALVSVQPVNWSIWTAIAVVVFLLFASAMISGSEVAFFSLKPSAKKLLKQKKTKVNALILNLLENPKLLLATILISNSFINITIVILTYFIIEHSFLFDSEIIFFLVNVVLVTFIIVLFGEVIPKVYANMHNIKMAGRMSRILWFLQKFFSPLSFILIKMTYLVDKRLAAKHGEQITTEEIDHAIDIAAGESSSAEELRMLKGIVTFGNTTVRQIMRSRVDIVALDKTETYRQVMQTITDSGYSRFPVFTDNLDHISGLLYAKDMLPYLDESENFHWQQLIRPPIFVPENKKIDDLLHEFQSKKIHLAVVVDEYGGTSGIISLEDILEEIIGEITDEFDDVDDIDYQKIDDHNFVFEGKTLINDMCKVLNLQADYFDEVRGESDSIAGLILEINGKFPQKGESIVFKNYRFTVKNTDSRRITSIKLTLLND